MLSSIPKRKGRNVEYLSSSGKPIPSSSLFLSSLVLVGTSLLVLSLLGSLGFSWFLGLQRQILGWSKMGGDLFRSGDPFCSIPLLQADRFQLSREINWVFSLLSFWGSPRILSGTCYEGPSLSWKRKRKHLWYKAYPGMYFKVLPISENSCFSKFVFSMDLEQY